MLGTKKAFTLIELMVVIVIIGILAALAIPKFNEASVKAKASEAPTVLSSYDNSQLAYLAETNALGDVTRLVMADPTKLNSKYYVYSEAAAGRLNAVANASGMGKMGGANLWTVISTDAVVTHSSNPSSNVAIYLPNWDHTTR